MVTRTRIPPPPLNADDKGVWSSWYIGIVNAINNLSASLKWTLLDFTGSNITDIKTKSHQALDNLQGGSSTERYHLTSTQASAISAFNATQWTDLTDSGASTLHYHTSDRDSANFTGTNWTDLTDGGYTTLHTHVITATATLNFPSISSNGLEELTVTVTGATVGRPVVLGPPAGIEAGLTWCGYVSATDTVKVRVHNNNGSSTDPVSADWTVSVHN